MDLTSGAPYWPLKNGLLGVYPSLRHDESCDVAIIGGGVTGALVAWHLAKTGQKIVLLDRREIGFGSTCASTALLLYELDTDLVDLASLIGKDEAFHAYLLCRDAIDDIETITRELGNDCGFERRKSFYLASRNEDVDKLGQEFDLRREAGLKVEYFNRRAIESCSSLPHPAAILSHEAACIDAFRFTHKLLEAAVQRGVKVYDRTSVDKYEIGKHGITLQTNREAVIKAKQVVFAVGYEAPEQLKQQVVELHSTYVALTEPLPSFEGWPNRSLLWETSRPYLYLRPTSDGRAMIGGEDIPFKNELARDKLLLKKTEVLLRRFRELFPAIDARLDYAWAGTFGATKDGLAYIGPTDEFPGAQFALGFGGNGITYSVIAAQIIRDAIYGKENQNAHLFRFDR